MGSIITILRDNYMDSIKDCDCRDQKKVNKASERV